MYHVEAGRDGAVRVLLEAGATAGAAAPSGWSPLLLTVSAGYADVVDALLAKGAPVGRVVEATGEAALSLAARGGTARARAPSVSLPRC